MNLAIVVRTVGERTTTACELLLREEFPDTPIVLTKGFPLSEGVKVGFKEAIRLGKEWTLIVDADTITLPGTTQKLIESVNSKVFWCQGDVNCKFLGTRQGGNYLYRTELLEQTLPLIKKEMIRPENAIAEVMQTRGYKSVHAKGLVTCVHDYEQYYRDIYRKFVVHGVKFQNRMRRFKQKAEKLKKRDPDFLVALAALKRKRSDLIVDASLGYSKEIEKLGLKEKPPLSLDQAIKLRDKYANT